MRSLIWENSVHSVKSSTSAQYNQKKKTPLSSHTKNSNEEICTQLNNTKSFSFETQRVTNRLEINKDYLRNPKINEHSEITDRFYGIMEKSCLEKYLQDISKEQNSPYIVHTFARPRRLVAIKVKSTDRSDTRLDIKSPSVRLGMTGWKLMKPRCVSTELTIKSKLQSRSKNFEIVSKRIL